MCYTMSIADIRHLTAHKCCSIMLPIGVNEFIWEQISIDYLIYVCMHNNSALFSSLQTP